jgi:hypothetical protein
MTAGQAIGVLGLAYWAYRSGQCAGDKLLRRTDCDVTKALPCPEIIAMGPQAFKGYMGKYSNHPYQKCISDINKQLMDKIGTLELQLADTLAVVATFSN